jgi:hypothetical protein
LAKHKKKTSEPTPKPEDSKKESIESKPEETPETESSTSMDTPPTDSSTNQAENVEQNRKLNTLFWLRVGLAIIAGTAATFIFEDIEGEERRWSSIGFMIIVFAGTLAVAKTMKMQLPRSDRKKFVTQGMGSYVFLYLFTWVLTYTLVHTGSASSGINL